MTMIHKIPFIPSFIIKPDFTNLSRSVKVLYLFELTLNNSFRLNIRKQYATSFDVRLPTTDKYECQKTDEEVHRDKCARRHAI